MFPLPICSIIANYSGNPACFSVSKHWNKQVKDDWANIALCELNAAVDKATFKTFLDHSITLLHKEGFQNLTAFQKAKKISKFLCAYERNVFSDINPLDLKELGIRFEKLQLIQAVEKNDFLSIEGNHLIKYDPAFTNLPIHEKIEKIHEIFLKELIHIESPPHDIDSRSLSIIPTLLFQCVHLNTLLLFRNKIKFIPNAISNLSNLVFLELDNNELETIPPQLCELPNLQTLMLSDNHINCLPQNIGNSTALTTLYLSNNRLAHIPPGIGNLTNLTTLELQRNQLIALPSQLEKLVNLQVLELEIEDISSILPENLLIYIPNRIRDRFHLNNNSLENAIQTLFEHENFSSGRLLKKLFRSYPRTTEKQKILAFLEKMYLHRDSIKTLYYLPALYEMMCHQSETPMEKRFCKSFIIEAYCQLPEKMFNEINQAVYDYYCKHLPNEVDHEDDDFGGNTFRNDPMGPHAIAAIKALLIKKGLSLPNAN